MKVKRFVRCTAVALAWILVLGALVHSAEAVNSAAGVTVAPDTAAVNPPGHRVTTVRRSPSAAGLEIGCFEDGTRITVLGKRNGFYRVDCFDMLGYIAQDQVREESGEYYVNCQAGSSETKYLPVYSAQDALSLRDRIRQDARKYLGVPYVHGGTGPYGFDCSGYTMYIFQHAGKALSRSLLEQMAAGVIVAKEDLQCGDLVIFSNTGRNGGFASHIGIYIGNNQVIHASSSRGIAINDLDSDYYLRHYQCARRIVLTELAPTVTAPTAGILHSSGTNGWRAPNNP